MRIYRTDGSFIENSQDNEFGWSFSEIIVDEGLPCRRSSSSSLETIEDQVIEPVIMENKIPEYSTKNIIGEIELEGPGKHKRNTEKLENIDSSIPSKEDISNLIHPYSSETKMLLSIVFFSKYKKLIDADQAENMLKMIDFNATNFKCFLNDDKNDKEYLERELYSQIQDYHASKEDNMLSLMAELILADMDSKVEDLVDSLDEAGSETSDLGNSIQGNESVQESEGAEDRKSRSEMASRSDVFSSIGLSEDIDKSIQNFCNETYDMHLQLDYVRRSFEIENHRLDKLFKEVNLLSKDLRETLYLDNVINLLNGKLECVKFPNWPFRIFNKPPKDMNEEINLIV